MTTLMSWIPIGKIRRRRPPMTTGKTLSRLWDDLRIMPIWSNAVATHLCHPGRVSVLSRHAAFQLVQEHLPPGHVQARMDGKFTRL